MAKAQNKRVDDDFNKVKYGRLLTFLSLITHLLSCLSLIKIKKALRETQTLRAGCSKVEPKIFAPPQTPFLRAQDGQNLIHWRWSLPLPTDRPSLVKIDARISSYRGNRPTQTHPPTDRGDYTTLHRS